MQAKGAVTAVVMEMKRIVPNVPSALTKVYKRACVCKKDFFDDVNLLPKIDGISAMAPPAVNVGTGPGEIVPAMGCLMGDDLCSFSDCNMHQSSLTRKCRMTMATNNMGTTTIDITYPDSPDVERKQPKPSEATSNVNALMTLKTLFNGSGQSIEKKLMVLKSCPDVTA
eukprot:CAMPEP_0178430148 /NCGR_PEP_ID=MMETSP0689_2-20121128/31167_1 /TAXON_ID=160604 /ORGANISM="Amphidinium massartii, Strain CS-259" /LENGTH=168 /DNA_ID=CAMNT_0020051989 /DNA_START=132 /DNA_END=638 /DNA_ORIENTATION=-